MRRRTVFGIIFIVAGLLKLADMWNIVRLEWLWQQPWTTYFGVGLIIYRYRTYHQQLPAPPRPVDETSTAHRR